ncbi:MAG: isoleucine--tRNA ligase [bacterium]
MSERKPVFQRMPSQVVAPEVEEQILSFWEEKRIFEKSISQRSPSKRFVFYEGPPTANGEPGVHHVITRVVKDLVCRYKTMKGYQVLRKAGWDTHGLPVEIEVEKELKIQNKEEIERYGIDNFNRKCKESVFRYEREWVKMTKRIGFWLDLENPYITCTKEYIESVWYILRRFWDAGLIYKGHKVLPYCARCGTPLSSHEVSQGYDEKEDPSIYVKLSLVDEPGTSLLVWTTTPWTLISNVAVAVNPDLTYLKVRYGEDTLILAENRASAVLGEGLEVIERVKGKDLVGLRYRAPFEFVKPEGKAHIVVSADFVSAEDGTGLVHTAPAFGEEDYNLGRSENLAFVNPVREDGAFDDRITPWKGKFVIDTNQGIIEDLRQRGLLLKAETVVHTYPFCWRCDSPLIYYAHPSWYIKTTAFKDEMIEINKKINWYPKEYGYNRFGQWLENNVDWALSRERYWGTPLNIWICGSCGYGHCVGSLEELKRLAIKMEGEIDLHRPWIDGVKLRCEECGGVMDRTPEVIDCWFDTGGMPYAQYHYPFENRELFESQFPADFICEAVDQTRGWFYSLLAISTFMSHQSSFRNVMVAELILDEKGQKMSKSRGNVVRPRDVLSLVGADPLRWYLYSTSPIWIPKRFSTDQVVEVARKMLGTLRNVAAFFSLYANIDGFDPRVDSVAVKDRTLMDRWIISRLNSLVLYVDKELENYEITRAARAIQEFVIEELSNWYVRRSRRRYWRHEMNEDKISAYCTLYEVLITLSKILAPFMPFVSEEIYRHLVAPVDPGKPESVHLEDFPIADRNLIDEDLEEAMSAIISLASLVRAARNRIKIKVKQPLMEVKILIKKRPNQIYFDELIAQLKDEVNVKNVVFADDLSGFVSYEVKPRFDLLGPRLGERVKRLQEKLAHLDSPSVARLENQLVITVDLDGEEIEVKPDEVIVKKTELEGWVFESDGMNSIVLDTRLDEDLLAEGYARELVSTIQNLRKKMGFDVTDNIRIFYESDDSLNRVIEKHQAHIMAETLAISIENSLPKGSQPSEARIGGQGIKLVLQRLGSGNPGKQ